MNSTATVLSPATNPPAIPRSTWLILLVLFLVNLLNFFDRTLPAMVNEPIRKEWGLSDFQLGLVNSAFVVVYALAGMPLGRLADKGRRMTILAWGVGAWSAFTATTGLAWSYWSFFANRLAVGVGEASCAPAATSLIGDLFPAQKRARAMGLFMLGLPLGLVCSYFAAGPLIRAFGSWRAPFFVAGIPGLILAVVVYFLPEPPRGAADAGGTKEPPESQPIRKLLRRPTLRWLILSGVTVNFAAYAGNGFLVSLLMRYFGLSIEWAGIYTGIALGLTGLVGLLGGGWIADRIYRRTPSGRLVFGAACLALSAPLTWFALRQGEGEVIAFTTLFGLGWLTYYNYYTSVYPAIHDVVVPRLRGTAMALYFAGMYLLGGAAGTMVVGGWSDAAAQAAMKAAGATEMTERFKAIGLHEAMYLIPLMLALTAVTVFLAARTFATDAAAMRAELERGT